MDCLQTTIHKNLFMREMFMRDTIREVTETLLHSYIQNMWKTLENLEGMSRKKV